MNAELQRTDYLAIASTVRRRIARGRFVSALRRTHWIAALMIVSVVLAGRSFFEWRSGEWRVAAIGVLAWLGAAWIFSKIGLPGTARALRLLDQRGGWKDCFSSAWEFLGRETRTRAEELHLSRAGGHLASAREKVAAIFPVRRVRHVWIAPALAVGLALLPWGRIAPDARDLALTDGMKDAATGQADEIKREARRIEVPEVLTEEEKAALEALRADVEGVAEALANPDGLTAGEMLAALDERARAAEKLAEKLDRYSDEWASPEMLAEMSQHPDTADLSLLIADKAAEGAAAEADDLSETLDDPTLSGDTLNRLTRSVESISGAAQEADLTRPVGERFGNASRKLLDAQAKTAGREFAELAKFFRELAAREEARKALEKLAENLREAGGEIGGSELKKMEQVAEASGTGQAVPEGLKGIDAETGPSGQGTLPAPGPNPQEMASAPGQGGAAPAAGAQAGDAPVPGQNESGSGAAGQQAFAAPVPGEPSQEGKSGAGLGAGEQSRDGQGEGGMLSAPIPGMDSGAPVPGAGLATAGNGASSQSGQGGDQAGVGTAKMTESQSDAFKAKGDSQVLAQSGREGESTMRAIEGGTRTEAAGRTRQELVTEFLSVEEQALDDQALPMSRRQHVLRYFSAIRQQFEKPEPE